MPRMSSAPISRKPDVIRKLLGDRTGAGVDADEAKVREAIGHKEAEARRQIMEQTDL